MKKYALPALLLTLTLCALSAPALADTHTLPELGLTVETPEGWLFIAGEQPEIDEAPEMQAVYDLLGSDVHCRGLGFAHTDSVPYLIWYILSYEQPAWWIRSYRGLSDDLLLEINKEGTMPGLTVVRGKAAKFVLYEESNPEATAIVAYTIEDGRGICFYAGITSDAPAAAAQQVRDMLSTCAFGDAMSTPAP
jgi:hypothetical protein